MTAELIDTHCHLDLAPLDRAVDAVLARAAAAGVRACLTIGTTLPSSRAAVALAQRVPHLRAAVGVHPREAESVTEETLAAIDRLAAEPGVAAIGEVGLDTFRGSTSLRAQEQALCGFVAIAQRRGLPLAVHCRDAYEPLLALLRRETRFPLRGALHCASGPAAFIQAVLALGLHVSFAGNVTFPNAKALRALVPLVPDERLLIETDAPFLAPQPVRGGPNEPAYVAHTARCLAALRGMTVERLGAVTSRNASALFGFPV